MKTFSATEALAIVQNICIPGLEDEHRITKGVIRAIPLDKGDYRPDEISKSAIDLAWHIVAAEMRFFEALPAGEFDFTPKHRPETVQDSADLLEWYVPNFQTRVDKLRTLSGEQLIKVIDFRGIFKLQAFMYLNFILGHTIHHRGQLSMYLRPMGAKVPSIYGESYDAAEARKAAMAETVPV
jgi:uncharacterized damage-inducible protein DinB